jgi:predicted nucleic acid-binding Zn finger protein
VEIVVNEIGRIIFGRCTCAFFADNLMNLGPCEHMLAIFKASEEQRREGPVSTLVTGCVP